MSAKTRKFATLDVVTVATGVLVSDRGIGSVYEVCGWMLDDTLMTHQLPNASRTLEPYITEQHPWIADLRMPTGDLPALKAICARIVEEYGSELVLERPESPEWVTGNALANLHQIADGRRVIEVEIDDAGVPVVTDSAVEIDIRADMEGLERAVARFNRAVKDSQISAAEAATSMRKLAEHIKDMPDEGEEKSA